MGPFRLIIRFATEPLRIRGINRRSIWKWSEDVWCFWHWAFLRKSWMRLAICDLPQAWQPVESIRSCADTYISLYIYIYTHHTQNIYIYMYTSTYIYIYVCIYIDIHIKSIYWIQSIPVGSYLILSDPTYRIEYHRISCAHRRQLLQVSQTLETSRTWMVAWPKLYLASW